MAHTFEDLVTLERAAEQAHAQLLTAADPDTARAAWIQASAAFQAAVTEYAAATEGESRVEVEMRVKRAVRHPEGDA
ncbi:hypothetical protein AB0N99_31090 [Streptomyces sp. NPDC093272]|uniref:hypothetical protein n=1 Tax=Streptomyces sp. NPDC093272 TaxID=3154981 RepID=UPI00342F93D2